MALQGALAEAVREGKELLCGELDIATASETITTPFAIVDAVVVTQKKATSPGVGSSVFTYDVADNVVTVYAWKVTATGNATLVAGTAASEVSYTIIGRRP